MKDININKQKLLSNLSYYLHGDPGICGNTHVANDIIMNGFKGINNMTYQEVIFFMRELFINKLIKNIQWELAELSDKYKNMNEEEKIIAIINDYQYPCNPHLPLDGNITYHEIKGRL